MCFFRKRRERKRQEALAREEAEKKAKEEADLKAKQEADAKAQAEAEQKAKEEADAKAKAEAEAKAKEEAEAQAKAEADAKAKEEADAKAKEEADAKAKAEADAKTKADADAKVKAEEVKKAETKPAESAPVKEEPKPEEKPVKAAPKAEKKPEEVKDEPKDTGTSGKYSGKYEVYPEAGMFKFRLKASNGEILLVSIGYKTMEGAEAGIKTIKKNIEIGNSTIVTDKNGYSQFRFNTSNNARIVIAGEYYNSLTSCQNALKSTQKFYSTDKIVELDKIPASEIREELVTLPDPSPLPNAKFEIFIDDDGKYRGRLIASNGEILFVTNDYANKQGVLTGLGPITQQANANAFHICRDKQNRYQFRLYSAASQIILNGETYSSKDAAVSAATSVRNFISGASIIDTTKAKEEPAAK